MTKLEGMLGLAARAGKVASGSQAVEAALKNGAALVLADAGISARSLEELTKACNGKPPCILKNGLLGQAIGKPGRMIAAVTDDGFGKKISELIALQ